MTALDSLLEALRDAVNQVTLDWVADRRAANATAALQALEVANAELAEARRTAVVELTARGVGPTEIGRHLGLSKARVQQIRDHGTPKRKQTKKTKTP